MLQGRTKDALRDYQLAVAAAEHLVQIAPDNFAYRSDLTYRYGDLARGQRDSGDAAGAIATNRKSLAVLEDLVRRDPANQVLVTRVAGRSARSRSSWARPTRGSRISPTR